MTGGAAHAVPQPPLWHLANHPNPGHSQCSYKTAPPPSPRAQLWRSLLCKCDFVPDCCFQNLPRNPCHGKVRGIFSSQQLRPFHQRHYIETEDIALESWIRTMDMRPAIKRPLSRERMKRIPYVMSKINVECLRYERLGQQLLPGIPNEITLYHITPKLPWTAFGILSSVSYSWREAIQSRQVSHARGRSQSKENFTLIKHHETMISPSYRFLSGIWFALYSPTEKIIYRLPGIPRVASGIPDLSKSILLDDKVYVLGGLFSHHNRIWPPSRSMYVMDLAGQKHWERCASLKSGRIFESYPVGSYCRILDGNIIVYEAFDRWWLTPEEWWRAPSHAEIYDPKLDVWSPIKYYPELDFWAYNESQLALGRGWRWADEPDLHPSGNHEEYVQRTAILNAYVSELCDRDEWTRIDSEHSSCRCLRGPDGFIHTIEYGGKARL